MKSNTLKLGLAALTALAFVACGESSSTSGNENGRTAGKGQCGENGTFTDARDGQVYKCVTIGAQTWMAQNLNYGEMYPAHNAWKYCYDDSEANCERYGGLYPWHLAMNLPYVYDSFDSTAVRHPHQGICPQGWHLPTKDEWKELIAYVDNDNGGWPDDEGWSLQSKTGWTLGGGKDTYGFNALPAGACFFGVGVGGYTGEGTHAEWHSATGRVSGGASVYTTRFELIVLDGYADNGKVVEFEAHYDNSFVGAFPVRCVQDVESAETIGDDNLAAPVGGTFVDERDGQTYDYVTIGSQVWMAQNLNFGTMVADTLDQNDATNEIAQKYCLHDSTENCAASGGLYQWHTAMAFSQISDSLTRDSIAAPHRGICPQGWHLPTFDDWTKLKTRVGETRSLVRRLSPFAQGVGSLDAYGFSASPSGRAGPELNSLRDYDTRGFYGATWWLANASDGQGKAWDYGIWPEAGENGLWEERRRTGLSVRCVKD